MEARVALAGDGAPSGAWIAITALTAALAVAGCVDVRDRPADPTAPDESADLASFVIITHPTQGQTILRSTFTQEPGVQVTFTGRLQEGDELLLLVFTDQFPVTPVFASEARVDAENVPTSARIRLSPTTIEGASEMEILLRVLEAGGSRVISTDSVGVLLR